MLQDLAYATQVVAILTAMLAMISIWVIVGVAVIYCSFWTLNKLLERIGIK